MPIIRDRAANGVAGLYHAARDFAFDDVNLGQAAIAAKDIGKTLVWRINQRGMAEITQAFDPRQRGTVGLIDQQDRALGAFDHQAKIAGGGGFT